MFKLQIAICCILVAVEGGLIASSPVQVLREADHYPQYNYGYSVQDPITGDVKGQEESRDGDVVRGRYSLIEADGTLRIVTYMADNTGFHAVVEKQPGYSTPVAVVNPIVVQRPVQPVHVQVPFRPLPPPQAPVQVHPEPQPQPIEEVFHPHPQPVEVPQFPTQPQPQPPQQQFPVQPPQQQFPVQPQPLPPQQPPQQQFPVQPQPLPPQQPPQQPQPTQPSFQPPQPQETFDDAEVIEARRANAGRGSSFTFRSSRMGQHDFNYSF